MKAPLYVSLLAAIGLSACEKKPETASVSTNAASSASSPLDAPGNYLKAVANGQQSAVKTVDTTSLNKAIELFNVDQGRNPKDLDELVQKKYIPKIPEIPFGTRLQYDSTAGNVKVVPVQKQ